MAYRLIFTGDTLTDPAMVEVQRVVQPADASYRVFGQHSPVVRCSLAEVKQDATQFLRAYERELTDVLAAVRQAQKDVKTLKASMFLWLLTN